jgi:beta-lactamase class A
MYPELVQHLLGHASIQRTLDGYSHWIPSMGAYTASAMDEASGYATNSGSYFLWYSERSTETTAVATVDRLTYAEPPDRPAPPRSHTVDKLHSKLPRISEAHAETYRVVVFDPYFSEYASLKPHRRVASASLSKLYALLTLNRAAARAEVGLEDEITMRASEIWAYGTGVLYMHPNKHPVGYTKTPVRVRGLMIKESYNTAELMLN